jgi:hypothetical protein
MSMSRFIVTSPLKTWRECDRHWRQFVNVFNVVGLLIELLG